MGSKLVLYFHSQQCKNQQDLILIKLYQKNLSALQEQMKNWRTQMTNISYIDLKKTKLGSIPLAVERVKKNKKHASNALYNKLKKMYNPEEMYQNKQPQKVKRFFTQPNEVLFNIQKEVKNSGRCSSLNQLQEDCKKFISMLNKTKNKFKIVKSIAKSLTQMQITSNRFLFSEADQQKQIEDRQIKALADSQKIIQQLKHKRMNSIVVQVKKPIRISFKLRKIQQKSKHLQTTENQDIQKNKKLKQFSQRRNKFNLFFKERIREGLFQ